MKKNIFSSLFIFFLLFGFLPQKGNGQIANAGTDQHIYLSQTSTAVLDGTSSSGTKYKWSDISTDYPCPATITSPTSKTTTLKGLKQGVFYFQLAVSKGSKTVYDTVMVNVDFDKLPPKAKLIENLPIAAISTDVNNRSDTSGYIGYVFPNRFATRFGHVIYLERSRLGGMHIDQQKGKFYSTIEDGYQWNNSGYARSECTYGGSFLIDSNKTYLFEWKGYFPQKQFYINKHGVSWANIVCIFQIHSNNSLPPPLALSLGYHGNIYVGDLLINKKFDSATIANYADFINKTHTVRITFKEGEGYPGQDAFVKVEIDGVEKYFRNKGSVGGTFQHDYIKFGGLYDWQKWIVDPQKKSRGRKFSLVTESFHVYQLEGK
ncbi:MAG TPA: hypothetical protein VLS85_01400 [Hanamia sp.]|nr:hypothetical protein [Hanamia sp.]